MSNQPYEIIQIGAMSWRIEENGVRVFLFAGTEKALLIDTGYGTGDLEAVISSLTALPVILVNTHADRDHVGGNKQFVEAHLHPDEVALYNQTIGEKFPVKLLQNGDIIDIGARRFEIVAIPGHTPGSIALLDADNRIIVSGDSVAELVYMFGEHRNFDNYIASLQKLIEMRNRFDMIYPSHGLFPLSADILNEFLDGAKRVYAEKAQGEPASFEKPAKVYDVNVAKFLY